MGAPRTVSDMFSGFIHAGVGFIHVWSDPLSFMAPASPSLKVCLPLQVS